ncbi:MAG: NRDE family protein [Herbaspirillum sp.]
MCLIVFAWQVVPNMPLIAAGNRDEFYARPSSPAAWWDDQPDIYAGRDLRGGGTWMGINRAGHFAALTNIRAPIEHRADAPSRGALVTDFLADSQSASRYAAQLAAAEDRYNGFNLLLYDGNELVWYSNRGVEDARNGLALKPGIYGISNGLLDTAWPKVVRTKAQFASLLCQSAPTDTYFEMLADTTKSGDCRLPKTGVSIELERLLSAVCIESPEYGTRSSTLVRIPANGVESQLCERVLR